MPTDQHSSSGRRPNFRHRRGHDRRGDRRPAPAPQSHEPQAQAQADHANVDQIIKDIKSRISQRHGIDLSGPQIQELAARRLEAILDPRNVKPGLLDQLRRAAGAPADIAPAQPLDAYTFEDHTIYDTHSGFLRFMRKLLNPILKLFFNPNPLTSALHAQVRVNREAAKREAERERTQAEWNALHYTMIQRMVTETARVSIEMQSLAQKVEALSTRTDLAERKVRSLETTPAPAPAQRTFDMPATAAAAPPPSPAMAARPAGEGTATDGTSDGARRRRRRRRGRRGNTIGGDAPGGAAMQQQPSSMDSGDAGDDDDGFDDAPDAANGAESSDAPEGIAAPETSAAAAAPEPYQPRPLPAPPVDEPPAAPSLSPPVEPTEP